MSIDGRGNFQARTSRMARLFKLQLDSSSSADHPNVPDAELSPSCLVGCPGEFFTMAESGEMDRSISTGTAWLSCRRAGCSA